MTKHDMVANIRKEEREENKRNGREASNDQEVILNSYLRQTDPKTVFTSRTPPKRDHHGYTRG